MTTKFPPPQRQIRAYLPSPTTITLYQAYSSTIAISAVTHQFLSASPSFSLTRTTWLKPSWAWMLYRSGYATKDKGQAHILAITMEREYLWGMLRGARCSAHTEQAGGSGKETWTEEHKRMRCVVQWDPERSVTLEKLGWRSIQIGVAPKLVEGWVKEGIVRIEDVTERARELKRVLNEGDVGLEELLEKGLVPMEQVVDVPEDVRAVLGME